MPPKSPSEVSCAWRNVRSPGAPARTRNVTIVPVRGAVRPPATASPMSIATRVQGGVGSSLPSSLQVCAGAELDGSWSRRVPEVYVFGWLAAGASRSAAGGAPRVGAPADPLDGDPARLAGQRAGDPGDGVDLVPHVAGRAALAPAG